MAVKIAVSGMARVLVAAGLLLFLDVRNQTVVGADPPVLEGGARLRGLDGERVDLSAPAGGAAVLIFYSTECPISNAYSPTLSDLIGSFRGKAVGWFGVCVDPDLTNAEVKSHARDFSLK